MTMVATYTTINTHVRILFPFPILFIIASNECPASHSMPFFHSAPRDFFFYLYLSLSPVLSRLCVCCSCCFYCRSSFSFFFSTYIFFLVFPPAMLYYFVLCVRKTKLGYTVKLYNENIEHPFTSILANQAIQIDCSCCCCYFNVAFFIFASIIYFPLILIVISRFFTCTCSDFL